MRRARWVLFRNCKTHYRTGEDFVSRVGHFKKKLMSARRQSDQDNRIITGVRPCTFPVVDDQAKPTRTRWYINTRFAKQETQNMARQIPEGDGLGIFSRVI
jgi:hypothetical protein